MTNPPSDFPGNDALAGEFVARYCDPQELPAAEHVWLTCAGCGAAWWNDEDCGCSCQPGNPRYEQWTVGCANGIASPHRDDHAACSPDDCEKAR